MLKKKYLDENVLEASKQRIIKLFETGNKFRLSFSGGKDSIVLADIIYNLCLQGKINKDQFDVMFIDEEAMYDDVIEIVKKWRTRFISIGVKFTWYCLQVKHFNCLNSLSDEENFLCWDESQKENWVRQPPKFAVMHHKLLDVGKDNYQKWHDKLLKSEGIIDIIGIMVSESVQRQKSLAKMQSVVSINKTYPIYDWTDKDIWLYIYKYNIEIPKTYENMYRIGIAKSRLRISQFFSIDTAKSLVSMGEMYPNLMERVIKREPNAYLCAMYWDTEMFGKSTAKRKKLEANTEKKDYKVLVFDLINNPEKLTYENKSELVRMFKMDIIRFGHKLDESHYKDIYDCLISGDPKLRKRRAIFQNFNVKYAKSIKKEQTNE